MRVSCESTRSARIDVATSKRVQPEGARFAVGRLGLADKLSDATSKAGEHFDLVSGCVLHKRGPATSRS
eukprot:953545-Pyramimonas_sp.AAC.1